MTNTINNTQYAINQGITPKIARIEYLNAREDVIDYTDYEDEATFRQDVMDELSWGVAIQLVMYRDDNGNTVAADFINDIDHLTHGVKYEDAPVALVL